jgi:hypothetical protein
MTQDEVRDLVERWLAAFAGSRLRVPGGIDARALRGSAIGIIDALLPALAEPEHGPGASSLREAEKRIAFAGGAIGMAGGGAFDVSAFLISLRDALARPELAPLFDWFVALAMQGFATSREEALRLRHRDSLERGTPVVMITRELPAALLVGEPDRTVLEHTFGRLLLSIVRVGARAVIIDGGGLSAPTDPAVLEALEVFGAHRKVAQVRTILSDLTTEAAELWRASFPPGAAVSVVERFDDAVALARVA